MILICSVLSFLLNFNKAYFVKLDFLTSFTKFLFYLILIQIIPKLMSKKKIKLLKVIEVYLWIAVIGALIQIIIVSIFGRSSWPLFSLGSQWFGLTNDGTMFVNTGMMRARSFYSEPAHFAVHISMLYSLLLFTNKYKSKRLTHILYIIGILSANSMSGWVILMGIYVIYFINFNNIKKMRMALGAGIVGIFALSALIMFNGYFRGRFLNLFALKDHSGVVRTVGGFHFLEYVPFYGVGIGNHANYYHSLTGLSTLWFSGSGEFYNVILLSIISIGYVGTVFLLLYQYSIFKKNKKLFLVFILTCFGWGKLWTVPVWSFLLMYKYISEDKYII